MKVLYKLNNNGKPMYWGCWGKDGVIHTHYGLLNGTEQIESYNSIQKDIDKEVKSKYNEKRKQGYIDIDEIVDEHNPTPVGKELESWLMLNLPKNLSNGNNDTLLPMLAKTYTGSFWKYTSIGLGQYKINGLRCIIRAYKSNDLFKHYGLTFQSREGIYWQSLTNLEEELLTIIPVGFLNKMIDENIALDGEIYLPGYSVNDINHFVKDATCKENKLLQYWCYDLLMESASAEYRNHILEDVFSFAIFNFSSKEFHLTHDAIITVLPTFEVCSDLDAIRLRDKFIDLGFEGLILRNPDSEYQFGRRRVGYMEKFKAAQDGLFKIVDIIKEPKRDLPIIICQNDINDAKFETRFSYPHDVQKEILQRREKYIGTYVDVKFGERSGIEKVPFHIKDVTIHNFENAK